MYDVIYIFYVEFEEFRGMSGKIIQIKRILFCISAQRVINVSSQVGRPPRELTKVILIRIYTVTPYNKSNVGSSEQRYFLGRYFPWASNRIALVQSQFPELRSLYQRSALLDAHRLVSSFPLSLLLFSRAGLRISVSISVSKINLFWVCGRWKCDSDMRTARFITAWCASRAIWSSTGSFMRRISFSFSLFFF